MPVGNHTADRHLPVRPERRRPGRPPAAGEAGRHHQLHGEPGRRERAGQLPARRLGHGTGRRSALSILRPHLHEALLRNQESSGAWVGTDPDSRTFGPNYCTAMAVLALTVEYRYLPIYQRGEEPTDRGRP